VVLVRAQAKVGEFGGGTAIAKSRV
jgi:hypothetical protein